MTAGRHRIRELLPEDLAAGMEVRAAPLVIDVRSRAEFVRGHVPGAVNIPFWRFWLRRPNVPAGPDDPIVVYCGDGPRARIAGAGLHRRGFHNLLYLAGNMAGWRRAGFPEERG